MTRLKQIGLAVLITLMFVGSGAMIGWIGFQEHFRLLARSFQQEAAEVDEAQARAEEAQALQDHSVIETPSEAEQVLELLEGRLRALERDDLPEE